MFASPAFVLQTAREYERTAIILGQDVRWVLRPVGPVRHDGLAAGVGHVALQAFLRVDAGSGSAQQHGGRDGLSEARHDQYREKLEITAQILNMRMLFWGVI